MIFCLVSIMSGLVGFCLGATIAHRIGYDEGVDDAVEYYGGAK